MAVGRRTAVLVVEEHQVTRALYVEALLAAGYMVHAVASPHEGVPAATTATFDIAIIDSPLDEAGLAIAERLGVLPKRPRLIAVTDRPANGAPLEWLFDLYIVKPCPPELLVDAVRSIHIPPGKQDLLIIARDRVGIDDILQRFGGNTAGLEVRLDLRRGERRRRSRLRTLRERRRAERRALDVNHWLRADGWAFVPAADRS